jgi:hypothetical protein
MSEEATFLDWCLRPGDWAEDWVFPGLKHMGFTSYSGLKRFQTGLGNCLELAEYDVDRAARLMMQIDPPLEGPAELDAAGLSDLARTWMEDVTEICRVSRWYDRASSLRQDFSAGLRRLRNASPWLIGNLGKEDALVRSRDAEGSVLMAILRRNPGDGTYLLFCGNMEGAAQKIRAADCGFSPEQSQMIREIEWKPLIVTPGTSDSIGPENPVLLENSRAIIWQSS